MIGETPSPPRAGRLRALLVVLARQRLDPGLAGVEAAGEVAQQVKRLGQHVLARHRLEFGNVERRTGSRAAPACPASVTRRSAPGGASMASRVSNSTGAALLHIGVDLVDGVLRRFRRAGHDRPVDQREEREFVARRDRRRRDRRPPARCAAPRNSGQAGHAGLDDGVDVGVAGDDVGQPGLRRPP